MQFYGLKLFTSSSETQFICFNWYFLVTGVWGCCQEETQEKQQQRNSNQQLQQPSSQYTKIFCYYIMYWVSDPNRGIVGLWIREPVCRKIFRGEDTSTLFVSTSVITLSSLCSYHSSGILYVNIFIERLHVQSTFVKRW